MLNRRYEGHPDGGKEKGEKEGDLKGDKKVKEGKKEGHVVVASEPSTFDRDDWVLMPKNSVLMVEGLGGEVKVEEVPKW